jgi:hypothetical protein
MHDGNEFVASDEFVGGRLKMDGAGLKLLAAEEVGKTVDRDVGFDEGGEDDGEDGEGEAEQGEEGDGGEDDFRRQGLARDR